MTSCDNYLELFLSASTILRECMLVAMNVDNLCGYNQASIYVYIELNVDSNIND